MADMKIQRHSNSWILSAAVLFRIQTLPCGMCGEQSGNLDRYFPVYSSFPTQYHSKNAPYSIIHLQLMLHNPTNCIVLKWKLLRPTCSFPIENIQGCW